MAMLFEIISSFECPTLAMPNEVNCVMKDCRGMMSVKEHLKASCFYFAFLTTALLCHFQFV